MRATKPILFSALAIAAAGCFLAAARSAGELQQRSSATARVHLWQAPLPPVRIAEQVVDLEAPVLEEEEAEVTPAEPETAAVSAAVVKKPRRPLAPEPLSRAAAVVEVDPEDAIRLALRGKRASFEHCYEQELKKQASFSGFIVVSLSVSASGQVTEAKVQEGNRRDAVVGACIVAQLRTLKLPLLTSEAEMLIPIRLQAREPT